MTHFRFRYKCMSYRRWRCRAGRRRTTQLMWPLAAATSFAPSTAAWRRMLPTPVLPMPTLKGLRVGDYLVGEEGDPALQGHPDIRY